MFIDFLLAGCALCTVIAVYGIFTAIITGDARRRLYGGMLAFIFGGAVTVIFFASSPIIREALRMRLTELLL
jgi:hypothetical protein